MSPVPRSLAGIAFLGAAQVACAQAGSAAGDYWVIHQQGGANTHELFVANGDPVTLTPTAEGMVPLTVHRLYEGFDKPVMTTYQVGVDCARGRLRLDKAHELQWDMRTTTPVKVSSAWQTSPDDWLTRSRQFVCQPGERANAQMTALGRMPLQAMIQKGNAHFKVSQRAQAAAPVMKMIDDAFARMPQK